MTERFLILCQAIIRHSQTDEYDEVRGLIGTVANETFADLFAQFLF
jgi:hypothetical protein